MKIKKNIAISESGYLFNPSTGESFAINPTGFEIFNMIREQKPFEEISAHFLEKYNTDKDTFEKDYMDFLNLLKHYLLLESDHAEES